MQLIYTLITFWLPTNMIPSLSAVCVWLKSLAGPIWPQGHSLTFPAFDCCDFPLGFLAFCPSAIDSGKVSGCSDEFRSLLSCPTPGALQLKKHLAQPGTPDPDWNKSLQSIQSLLAARNVLLSCCSLMVTFKFKQQWSFLLLDVLKPATLSPHLNKVEYL